MSRERGVASILVGAFAAVALTLLACSDGPELGDGTTVSRACLDHFQEAHERRAGLPAGAAASDAFWAEADYTDSFFDCESLIDWNIAVGLFPGSLDSLRAEAFVRESCKEIPSVADSPTCESLD